MEIRGGNGAAGTLGAAPGSCSQDSQLHPLGAPAGPTAPPSSGLEAPADLSGSFPRTSCLDLGSPLVGSPGSIRVATALNLTWRSYLQPRKMYLQHWVRFSPSGGYSNLHFLSTFFNGLPGHYVVKGSPGPYFKRSPSGRKGQSQSHRVVAFLSGSLCLHGPHISVFDSKSPSSPFLDWPRVWPLPWHPAPLEIPEESPEPPGPALGPTPPRGDLLPLDSSYTARAAIG